MVPQILLAKLARAIAARAGLEPPEWVLVSRLADRAAALGMRSEAEYVERVTAAAGVRELDLLIENLRVGETRFFRHRAHWRALIDSVIPALLAAPGGAVRAWSAGCATGEEAFTLAMLLCRHLPGRAIDVCASDISSEALALAQRRTYPATALAHVPDELRRWGFEPVGAGEYRVAERVAACVHFERRNLADGGFPGGFHVIFCRNVLIYVTPEARERTLSRLIDSLAVGGFLFVGYAESLRDQRELLALRTPDGVLYRKGMGVRGDGAAREANAAPATRADLAGSPVGAAPAAVREAKLFAEQAVIELCGEYADDERLASELAGAIGGSYRRVVVELDGASYLGDEAGAVLRRAHAAARAAGIEMALCAARPGTLRWLERHGLAAAKEPDT
jgi:chemotaxis protein methyltransferase CheR